MYLILNSLLTMLASIWFMTLVSLNWEHPTTCAKTQEVPSVQHPAYPYCSFVWGQKFDMQNLQGALKLHCNNPATLVGLLIFVRSLAYSFGNSPLNLRSMCLTSWFNITPFVDCTSGESRNSATVIPCVTRPQTSLRSTISLRNTLSRKCEPWLRMVHLKRF